MAGPRAERLPRRDFALVAGGGVAVSALAALAAGKPWVQVRAAVRSAGATAVTGTLEPYSRSSLALALALVALAAWGVLLVLRGRARTVMAVVGLAFGLALLVATVLGWAQVPDSVRHALAGQLGTPRRVTARAEVPHTGWYWLAVVCAAASVLAFGAAVRRAHRWPAMGTRYDAPGAPTSTDSATGQDMWRTLDEGRDPTDPGSA